MRSIFFTSWCRYFPSLGALALALFAVSAAAGEGRWYGGRSDGQWHWAQGTASAASLLSHLGRGDGAAESQSTVRFYGGYQFNSLLSVEAAHTSLGLIPEGCFNNSPTAPLQDACLGSAISMSAVSSVPVSDYWKMYGRMGLHTWQPGAPTLKLGSLSHEGGDYGRVLGLGVSYEPANNVTLRMESEVYTGISGVSAEASGDAQVQSISLTVHF
jgi:opacity protein-like surface antigen